MNVLLAEANVPYDLLYEPNRINDDFEATDVALIVGANDVVNLAARYEHDSPLYGMPILDADKAQYGHGLEAESASRICRRGGRRRH